MENSFFFFFKQVFEPANAKNFYSPCLFLIPPPAQNPPINHKLHLHPEKKKKLNHARWLYLTVSCRSPENVLSMRSILKLGLRKRQTLSLARRPAKLVRILIVSHSVFFFSLHVFHYFHSVRCFVSSLSLRYKAGNSNGCYTAFKHQISHSLMSCNALWCPLQTEHTRLRPCGIRDITRDVTRFTYPPVCPVFTTGAWKRNEGRWRMWFIFGYEERNNSFIHHTLFSFRVK